MVFLPAFSARSLLRRRLGHEILVHLVGVCLLSGAVVTLSVALTAALFGAHSRAL